MYKSFSKEALRFAFTGFLAVVLLVLLFVFYVGSQPTAERVFVEMTPCPQFIDPGYVIGITIKTETGYVMELNGKNGPYHCFLKKTRDTISFVKDWTAYTAWKEDYDANPYGEDDLPKAPRFPVFSLVQHPHDGPFGDQNGMNLSHIALFD